MNEENRKPQIRFTGFNDDWEQCELKEVLIERKILQKISHDAPILAFAAGQGVIDRNERKSNNRDHLTLDQANKKYKLTEYNDIVYNPSNLKYGAIDRNKFKRGVISPIYVTFTTDEVPSFIEFIVKSEKFKLRALNYEEGTVVKRQSVKPENLLSIDIKLSPFRDEQRKIGEFFIELDNLITLHGQKYENLVKIKKLMLEKMFTKKGNDIPEIRFKGFSDAWEQHKLDEVMIDFIVPMRDKPKEFSGTVPWTRIEDIEGKYLNGTSSGQYVASETISKMNLKIIPKNSLIVSASATFGVVAIVTRDLITNQTFIGLVPNDEYDLDFLYTFFKSPDIQMKMKLKSAGSTIFYISKDEFKELVGLLPSFEEQKKIGGIFKEIDNLISLHQSQLENLKNIKKSCLEKMFV